MGKRGPPPKGEYSGKSKVLSTRIRPDTRAALEAAKKESRRSLSQEIEHRLQRTFVEDDKIEAALGGRQNFAIMRLITNVMQSTRNVGKKADWRTDPYAFDQMLKAVNAVLLALRPPGDPPSSMDQILDAGGHSQGIGNAITALTEVQTADPSLPLHKGTRRDQRNRFLLADLGELAGRPKLFGRTAEETRQLHKLGKELGALMRKAQRKPDEMTNDERRRLHELHSEIDQIRRRKFYPRTLARPLGDHRRCARPGHW